MINDGDVIVLVLYLGINLVFLILNIRTVGTFLKKLLTFSDEVKNLVDLGEHI